MDMAVDTAGQHQLAAGINDAFGAIEMFRQRHDTAVPDPDIARRPVRRSDDGTVPDHKVEFRHDIPPAVMLFPSSRTTP